MNTKAKPGNGMAHMAKEAVRQSKEWSVAVREAHMSSMVEMLRWNPQMTSMIQPWLEVTRSMHDGWLDLWEQQAHDMIEHTAAMAEQGAQFVTPLQFMKNISQSTTKA